ncbi:MAG: FecR family protein [Planctomycetes bacterium]|nr:FecR family protein [Planctomycetota bacterium]
MMDQQREKELFDLLDAWCEGQLTPDSAARLDTILQKDAEARWQYLCYMELHGALQLDPATLARSATSGTALAAGDLRELVTLRGQSHFAGAKLGQSSFHLSRLALAASVVLAIGILAYTFWSRPTEQPVAKQTPAAKIVGLTDAKWAGVSSQTGDTLTSGQRLLLQSGSAEITFNDQARVILQGPAEFVVVDATGCRLATGRLTAHVPDFAKGFKVHTPDGTVTDLGTDFGVYVWSETGGGRVEEAGEEEQQPGGGPQFDGKQLPITEVHVFKGKVDVAPRDQLAQAPAPANPSDPSTIPHPPSTILQAGEAVTISDNKVQPLPAADPFKFALDKLQGKPRQVLLAEDFESYDVGVKRDAMGAWLIQGSSRKGQAVGIGDYDKAQADSTAQHGLADPSLNPPPPSISRLLVFAPSEPNPRSEFPRVARPIEAPQLAHTCRVLMEFVIFPAGNIEPSFAFAAEAGIAPGIEFWRNADPAAPSISWKPNLVYRVRVLMDVAEGKLRGARVERSQWSGSAGWVRDADFRTPVPTVDWTTPPKFVIFGYPTVTPQTPATPYNIDNIRIEVMAEK